MSHTDEAQSDDVGERRRVPGMLSSIFDRMRKESRDSGKVQEKIIEEFTSRLNDAFEHVHDEAKERERLLEEKLRSIEQEQKYKLQRVRILSVPATMLALVCLVYLFYVVHVMERSMTSMSSDITQMRSSMQNISGDTHSMADNVTVMSSEMSTMNGEIKNLNTNVGSMNRNVGHMTQKVGAMGRDVGAMSQSVSPVMSGMRSFMPF